MDSWREYFPHTVPITPTGWEIGEQFWPSSDLCCEANDASVCADVLTCQSMIICVLEHVWQKDVCLSENVYVCDWVSALLNYGACLLFNRSAEEVMPQSMSQPSCIIAPLCHCQRLGRATSDCFPLFPPFSFPLCLFRSPLQSFSH